MTHLTYYKYSLKGEIANIEHIISCEIGSEI